MTRDTTQDSRSSFPVAVAGGELTVHQLAGSADSPHTLIALHGITANGLSMRPLARAVNGAFEGPSDDPSAGTVDRAVDGAASGQFRVLAPDLAGRACSNSVAGPWGMGRHSDDVIAIADAAGAEKVSVLGHSMGAYVAAIAAARHPERFEHAVLVDGGIAFPPPPGTDIDELLTAVIGPAMTRLSMTFEDAAAYLEFMAANPAIAEVLATGDPAAADLTAYLEHDIAHDDAGRVVSSCVLEAIRVDGGAVLTEPETITAAGNLTVPTALLWAPRGLINQTPGLLTAEAIEAANLPDNVTVTQVPDCNHYSIMFAHHALAAITAAIGSVIA